ncbi:MAG: SDR family oxidoreductase [Gemmatimonadaceae bacterium]|nr:SDR family oxidoreductase [Gemmatimonadaceae bacterium]
MSALFSLKGKRAVVTGGTRGIGAAAAELLVDCGASVCVGYRSRKADADAIVARLSGKGPEVIAHGADLGEAAGADALVAAAVAGLGGVDVVIHSAGIWPPEEVPVHEMDDARWHRTMRENVDAMFFVSRAAARVLGEGGRIVHISSTAGQRGEAMHADYGASKGAMISFVKSQAVELARRGITVNCVAPGWVDTEMCVLPFADGGKARIEAGIPNGRVASAMDVAWAAVALCMPGARHVVGEIVNVNGGSVLAG